METSSAKPYKIKKRNHAISLLLCVVTLSVYAWIWLYLVCKDAEKINLKDTENKLNKYYLGAIICFATTILSSTVALVCFFLLVGRSFDSTIGLISILQFDVVDEEIINLLIVMDVFSGFSMICAITTVVMQCIIVYHIAVKINGDRLNYVLASLIMGFWLPTLLAQDSINHYAGDYEAGERPEWLHHLKQSKPI